MVKVMSNEDRLKSLEEISKIFNEAMAEVEKEFKTDEEFNDWLVENGYPRKVIESYGKWFYCRWWNEDEQKDHG